MSEAEIEKILADIENKDKLELKSTLKLVCAHYLNFIHDVDVKRRLESEIASCAIQRLASLLLDGDKVICLHWLDKSLFKQVEEEE